MSAQWGDDLFGNVTRSAVLTVYLMTFFARHIPSYLSRHTVLPILINARFVYSLVILYSTYCIGVGRGLDDSVFYWFRDILSIRYWESSLVTVLSGPLSVLVVRGMFN